MACRTNYYSPIPSPLHSPNPLSSFPRLRSFHDEDHTHYQNNLLIIIIVTASTAGAMIFLITLSTILRYYHYSRRSYLSRTNPPILFDIRGDSPFSDDEEHEQVIRHPIWFIPSEGLEKSTIDSITICKYRENEGLFKETECLVCLGEFQQEESLRLLPMCNHAFHVSCIDTWLRSHKSCPLCRALIVHDAGSVGVSTELDSNSSVSDMNEDIEESENGGVRVGDEEYSCEEVRDDGIHVLIECGEMNDHSSILIGSASDVSAQEFEGELREAMKRSVSMDSSFASREFCDVLDLNYDIESLDTNTNTNLGAEKKVSISSTKDIAIDKQGRESSTNYKHSSIGQWHFTTRSSSHNTKFIFSSCSRSQSSTLPL